MVGRTKVRKWVSGYYKTVNKAKVWVSGYYKAKDIGSFNPIICNICGFTTTDPDDMIKHLSQTQKHKSENCNLKILKCSK